MKVIGVVGLPASGKGEFSRIAAGMGIPIVVMGDVIREAVAEAGLPANDRTMGEMAGELRAREGMDAIARRCIPRIEREQAGGVLVDGIRGDAESDLFRVHFPRFFLIGIDAPFTVRLDRLARRGRPDDTVLPAELSERDRREIAWGLGRALTHADYTIHNTGSIEEFSREASAVLEEILEDP